MTAVVQPLKMASGRWGGFVWTDEVYETIRRMRAEGALWSAVGLAIGVHRDTARQRGAMIGVKGPISVAAPRSSRERAGGDPLPAGHPISWGILTAGTLLDGELYPEWQPMREAA